MVASMFLILAGMICGQAKQQGQLNQQIVELEPGKNITYAVPAMDAKGKRVTLSYLARGKGNYSGGYTYGLNVLINGRIVQAAEDRRMVRLLNKPLNFPYKQWKGTTYVWSRYCKRGTGWVIIFAPDYKPSDQQPWLGDQWANYVLAVEDLLYSGKPNVIEFRNDHPRRRATLMIDQIALQKTDQKGFGDLKPAAPFPDRPPRRTDFSSLKNPNVQVDNTGGLVIHHDGKIYNFETTFSYPQGGYNILGPGPAPEAGEKAFVPKVNALDAQTWQVSAQGKFYKIDRLIKLERGKVHVTDTISNKGDSPVGVIVSHYFNLGSQLFANILIGGNPDPAFTNVHMRANPTVFVPMANGGLGMSANDTLTRLQARFFYEAKPQRTGVRNEHLVIGPHKSYTTTRTIYVLQGPGYGDYFDFINYVRRDWDSNFRSNGPYVFTDPEGVMKVDDARLVESVKANNLYSVILTCGWNDPQSGQWLSWFTEFYWGKPGRVFDAYEEQIDLAVAKLRRLVPHVKIIHKYHSLLNVLDDLDQFPDSLVHGPNGQLVHYGGYRDLVYPTLTNSYGRGMSNMLEVIMTKHKVDGLYWDEFSGAGAGDSIILPYATFNRSDNHTAMIDPKTKQIAKTAAMINLLSDPWTKKMLKRLESSGAVLMANAPPCMPDYNDIKFPRMVEAQDHADRTLETNLYSPLCYTSGQGASIPVMRKLLEYAGVSLRSSISTKRPVTGLCFPLTPIELHRGWILAQERLITARSGRFGWDTKTTATLYRFNAKGKQIEKKQVTVPAGTAGTAGGLDIVVPDKGLVILVRS